MIWEILGWLLLFFLLVSILVAGLTLMRQLANINTRLTFLLELLSNKEDKHG